VATTLGSIPEEGLIETIEGAVRILVGSGDFSASPLADNNPYRITNSSFVNDLFTGSLTAGQFQGAENKSLPRPGEKKRSFSRLSEAQWAQLQEVGTLQVRPILFQSGTAALSMQGKLELDKAAESLQHYPDFRVLIKGHTSLQGDAAANNQLSLARAEAVKRYLIVTHDLDSQRVRTQGLGGSQPLPRQPGESARAYGYRLPRVEMVLLSEVL
jgi:outer membrane protein OmpA-like peptidoglycan-associated protein